MSGNTVTQEQGERDQVSQIGVRIDSDLWKSLRKIAIDLDLKLNVIVEEALTVKLRQLEKQLERQNPSGPASGDR